MAGKTFQIKLFYYFIADFNSDGKPDNITFMIKRIKVHNMNALKDPMYRFPGNYGVEKFLELFSGNFSGHVTINILTLVESLTADFTYYLHV